MDEEEDNVKWLERTNIGIPRYVILLLILQISLIIILIYIGILITRPSEIKTGEEYEIFRYEIFRDLLTVILAVAGTVMVAIGYGSYQFVSTRLDNRVDSRMKKREDEFESRMKKREDKFESLMKERGDEFFRFTSGVTLMNVGFSFWLIYTENRYLFSIDAQLEKELKKGIISEGLKNEFKTKKGIPLSGNAYLKKEKNDKWKIVDEKEIYVIKKEDKKLNIYEIGSKRLLDSAIDFTEGAYSHVKGLKETVPRNEYTKCQIMNNFGYYLAARGNPEDRDFARECAEFIRIRIDKYPDRRKHWQDTYDYIISKYPSPS